MIEYNDDDFEFGLYEAACNACDLYTMVNDLGLCEDCDAKLDRDFIRKRLWDYSASAFGCPVDKREELRKHIIELYGEALEILAADQPGDKKHKGKR